MQLLVKFKRGNPLSLRLALRIRSVPAVKGVRFRVRLRVRRPPVFRFRFPREQVRVCTAVCLSLMVLGPLLWQLGVFGTSSGRLFESEIGAPASPALTARVPLGTRPSQGGGDSIGAKMIAGAKLSSPEREGRLGFSARPEQGADVPVTHPVAQARPVPVRANPPERPATAPSGETVPLGARVAALGVAAESQSVSPTGELRGPRPASPRHRRQAGVVIDHELRSRYLLRAWSESHAAFAGRAPTQDAFLSYSGGDTYAVIPAAYYPPAAGPVIRNPDRRSRRSARTGSEKAGTRQDDSQSASEGYDGPERLGKTYGPRSFQPWETDPLNDGFGNRGMIPRARGFRFENVTAFQAYSSNAAPLRDTSAGLANLGYDIELGGSTTLAYRKSKRHSDFHVVYTPSLIRRLRFSEWNTLDHSLGLGASRKLSQRWDVNVSGRGEVRGLEESYFIPPVLRRVENPPTNFDSLVDAARSGQLNSDEIASVLTGTPVLESRARSVFDLSRVLSTSVGAGASYQKSTRLSFNFGVHASRYQALSDDRGDDVLQRRFLRRTVSRSAVAGLTYDLNPRTSVGMDFSVRRNFSDFRQANYLTSAGFISRRFGRRWEVRFRAGGGTIQGMTDNLGRSFDNRPTWEAGGSVSYRGRAHAFSAAAGRQVGDQFGLGALSTYRASAQYDWWRPGARWGITAGANWYQVNTDGFLLNTESKFVHAGIIRRLSPQTSVVMGYSYGSFFSPFRGVVSNIDRHRAQVSWVWTPTGAR